MGVVVKEGGSVAVGIGSRCRWRFFPGCEPNMTGRWNVSKPNLKPGSGTTSPSHAWAAELQEIAPPQIPTMERIVVGTLKMLAPLVLERNGYHVEAARIRDAGPLHCALGALVLAAERDMTPVDALVLIYICDSVCAYTRNDRQWAAAAAADAAIDLARSDKQVVRELIATF